MKNNLFLVFVYLLLTSNITFGQLGFHGGLLARSSNFKMELPDFSESAEINYKAILGINFGINYRMLISSKFALQPEINFLTKGGYSNHPLLDNSFQIFDDKLRVRVNYKYLELPFYLLYTGGNSYGFYAGAGPAINFGISGKSIFKGELFEGGGVTYEAEWGDDFNELLRRTHLALNVMAGYRMESGFDISIFYSNSLTNSAGAFWQAINNDSIVKWRFTNIGFRCGYSISKIFK